MDVKQTMMNSQSRNSEKFPNSNAKFNDDFASISTSFLENETDTSASLMNEEIQELMKIANYRIAHHADELSGVEWQFMDSFSFHQMSYLRNMKTTTHDKMAKESTTFELSDMSQLSSFLSSSLTTPSISSKSKKMPLRQKKKIKTRRSKIEIQRT